MRYIYVYNYTHAFSIMLYNSFSFIYIFVSIHDPVLIPCGFGFGSATVQHTVSRVEPAAVSGCRGLSHDRPEGQISRLHQQLWRVGER